MVTAASIAVLIALFFGVRFLRSLLAILLALVNGAFFLMLLFNGKLNHLIAGLACCLFVVFLWIYVWAKEEREQKERKEQDKSQGNLAQGKRKPGTPAAGT